MTPEERIARLEALVAQLMRSDRYSFEKLLQVHDGRNIQLGIATGTKIGTATTQKLSFYNATPVVRQASVTDADGTLAGATTAINTIIDRLQAYGLLP